MWDVWVFKKTATGKNLQKRRKYANQAPALHCDLTTKWNSLHCLRARRQPWSHEQTLWKSMGCHGCQVRSVWVHCAGSDHIPAFGCSAVEHSNDIHSVGDLIYWTHDGVLSQRLLLTAHCLSWVDIYFHLLLWRSTLLPLLLIWCQRMAYSYECANMRKKLYTGDDLDLL